MTAIRSKREATAYLTEHETYDSMFTVNISVDRLPRMIETDAEREAYEAFFAQDDCLAVLWDMCLRDVCATWEAEQRRKGWVGCEVFTEGRQGKHLCLSNKTAHPDESWDGFLAETVISTARLVQAFDALAVDLARESILFALSWHADQQEREAQARTHNTSGTLRWAVIVGDVPIHYEPSAGQYDVDDLEVRGTFSTRDQAEQYAQTVERYTVLVVPLIDHERVLNP
jgi:hypothetical protein